MLGGQLISLGRLIYFVWGISIHPLKLASIYNRRSLYSIDSRHFNNKSVTHVYTINTALALSVVLIHSNITTSEPYLESGLCELDKELDNYNFTFI